MEFNNLLLAVKAVCLEVRHNKFAMTCMVWGTILAGLLLAALATKSPKHTFLLLSCMHMLRSVHDGLEELNIMSALVLVMVCIHPETDFNVELCAQRLRRIHHL